MLSHDLYEQTDRVPVWSEPEYDASAHAYYLPDGKEMIFFHLDVFYMSHGVIKNMKERWAAFRAACPMMLFCMLTEECSANRRLIEMFGFEFLKEMPCTDGKTRNLFVNYGPAIGGPKE